MKGRRSKKIFTERELIQQIKELVGGSANGVLKGIGDDCAVVHGADGNALLVTTDTLVETIHFNFKWHTPYYLGRKAASVNISDIAAMGGIPRFALLSICMQDPGEPWVSDFLKGFSSVLEMYGVLLIGGDTVKAINEIVFSITIIGEGKEDRIVYRSGAKPDDLIWVTGYLGYAAAGLELYKKGAGSDSNEKQDIFQSLLMAHTNPTPQVKIGRLLAESQIAHSMMDISDGLATDLAHMCDESQTGAEILVDDIPISQILQNAADQLNVSALELAIKGGEDYQLLFTSSPDDREKVYRLVKDMTGCEMFCIGQMVQRSGVFLCHSDGQEPEISYQGYDHFS